MSDEYIKKIESEYSKNERNISKNNAVIHEINLLNFEERVGRTSIMATLLYLPVFFSLFFLNIPSAIFPGATLISTFGLGYIINVLTEKKAKCKKRVSEISKAKNQYERLEETLKLEIDNERLNVRNEIISRIKNKYINEVNMLKKFSKNDRYSILINKSNYNKEELIYKIEQLESELKIQYDLLDKLSCNEVLNNKKKSFNDKLSPIFYSMMYSMIPMILSFIPVFACIIARPLPTPSMIPFYTTFIPAILTFVGSLIHFKRKKQNTLKAIKSITNGDDKVNNNLLLELNKVKSQITNIIYSLNNYKTELNNYDEIHSNNNEKKKNMMNMLSEIDDLSLDNGPKLTLK